MTGIAALLRRSAAACLRAAGFALALAWVASEDLARLAVQPVLAALARLAFWRRLEEFLAALPPWGCLAALAIPYAAIQPAEIVSLVWLAEGRFAAGVALFAGSKILGMAVLLRMHAVAFDKLMTIGWYASAYRHVMALRTRLYERVLGMPGVREAIEAFARAASRLRGLVRETAQVAAAFGRRVFACLRARLASTGER